MPKRIPKISYSMLSAIDGGINLPDILRELDELGIDMIHYDVTDMNTKLHVGDISSLRKYTHLPFDVHLTVKDPFAYLSDVNLLPNDYICVHVENELSLSQLKEIKRQVGCLFGLAIRTETSINKLLEKASVIDYTLFMAADPGVSGKDFDYGVLEKIRSFRQHYPNTKVHVDGGVNHFSAALLRDAGVDTIISGSYIMKSDDKAGQVIKLFGRNLFLPVSDIMRTSDAIPVVKPSDPIRVVALEINKKKVGCTCVLSSDGKLLGLITDGDLRRCLITQPDLSSIQAEDIMNQVPFTTEPNTRLLHLLRAIEEEGRTFAIVPVIDTNQHCKGLLWLQDILFGNI
ncbi:CBS domain-containing protein [Chloroflexota bacterium]